MIVTIISRPVLCQLESHMTEDLSRSEESLQPNQSAKDYREPPRTVKGILKYLGPAFATLAITIGSGELIATTAAGAEIGIVVLWFLIISLFVKIGIQYIIAKYAMIENKTPHQIFDEVPGEIFGHSWSYWLIVIKWFFSDNIQYMGVFFGAAVLLHHLVGQTIPIIYTTLIVLLGVTIPALREYDFVEDFSTVLVLVLVALTLAAAVLSFVSPFRLSAGDIAYGLSFTIPDNGFYIIFGTIGITGVGTGEIIGYALFVNDAGYGKLAGSRDTEGWKDRMQGWLRVLRADVFLNVFLAAIVTVSFFIVGSSILANAGSYPDGPRLAVYLAGAYEQLFGPVGYWILIVGGFFALYSTIFGKLNLLTEVWPDILNQTERWNDLDMRRVGLFVGVVSPIIWLLGGTITGSITGLLFLGGFINTMALFPEIVTAMWILSNNSERDPAFQFSLPAKSLGWVSLIATFVMLAAVLVLQIPV